MKKTLVAALLSLSALSFAAPPAGAGALNKPLARQQRPGFDDAERATKREKHMRMMLVVGMAESMNLSEVEAIRLADRIKAFDERRRPIRESMHDGMKTLKAAADGESAALSQVDQATTKVLDGRAQMATLDREMFASISKDLAPQKRAQLALFLAKFQHEARKWKDGKGEGRGFHRFQRR